MRRFTLLALCFGLLTTPALAQTTAQIQKLNDQWMAAFNKGDASVVANFWAPDGDYIDQAGHEYKGRAAIQKLWEGALPHMPRFEPEQPLPTLISGDLALTSTPPSDGAGARAQVVRRQPDGTWLRVLDQPEFVTPGR